MKKFSFIVVGVVICLLVADALYFKDIREKSDAFAVSEAFLRKGVLGSLLKENSLIKVSPGTEALATHDICAENDDLKGYDYHNTYRLRFKMHSTRIENVHIKITFPKAKRYRELHDVLKVRPGRHFYTTTFVAHKGLDFNVVITPTKQQAQIILSDILVDARFGRTEPLVINGVATKGQFDQSLAIKVSETDNSVQGLEFAPQIKQLTYSVPEGLDDALYSGVFPGKKNQGFCRYVAYHPEKLKEVSQQVVPVVNLSIDEEYLRGDRGILDNKEGKGRAWEVPVQYSVQNGRQVNQQQAGLRFHGGTPGRKKNINSFRVNARDAYGKSTLGFSPLMGRERALDMKGVVFKYTYQAYDLKQTRYNPYNYAVALDVGEKIGALVSAHSLVDLNINDEPNGLYLAMEHLSSRTIKHWFGGKNFTLFTYKKYNTDHQQFALFFPIGEILKRKGEDAYKLFLESYDINNVLNSVMLSAYISDDDYCQGVDIIEQVKDSEKRLITSVNWDLDHAFLSFKDGQYSMPAKREGIGQGFDILRQNKPHSASLCPRKWVFSHVYAESKTFRNLVRERLEALLANELSPQSVNMMLDKYRKIDDVYYQNKHQSIIDDMFEYAQQRPSVLLQELTNLEQWVESDAYKPNL